MYAPDILRKQTVTLEQAAKADTASPHSKLDMLEMTNTHGRELVNDADTTGDLTPNICNKPETDGHLSVSQKNLCAGTVGQPDTLKDSATIKVQCAAISVESMDTKQTDVTSDKKMAKK